MNKLHIILLSISLFSQTFCKIIISIEGNTGAGKTTLLNILRQELDNVHFIEEPFDQWQNINGGENLFQAFITDKNRWTFTFQSWVAFTHLYSLTEKNNHDVTITDRSLHTALYCFVEMEF